MTGNEYNLSIEGQGVTVSHEINNQQFLQIMSIVLGGELVSVPAGQTNSEYTKSESGARAVASSETSTDNLSIGEFLSSLNIRSNSDRIAGIALYKEESLSGTRVKKDEIIDYFQKAGEAAPKNISRDIKNAIKKKLVAEDNDDSEQLYVTSTGKKHLRSTE